jgi:hypothetical protein
LLTILNTPPLVGCSGLLAGILLIFHNDLCNVLLIDITSKPLLVLDELLERHDWEPDSEDRPSN